MRMQEVLFVVIGISVIQIMIGMQNEPNVVPVWDNDTIKREIRSHAQDILEFTRKSDHSEYLIKYLGIWLTDRRKTISNDEEWDWLVENLIHKTKNKNKMIEELKGCKWCSGSANALTLDVLKIIKTTAYDLKAGDECAQILVNKTTEAVKDHYDILENGPWYTKKEEKAVNDNILPVDL